MTGKSSGVSGVSQGISRTLSQVSDPTFISVVIRSAIAAIVALIAMLWLLGQVWPEGSYLSDWIFGAGGEETITLEIGEGSEEDASEVENGEEEETSWLSYITGFFYWFTVVMAFYLLFPSLMTMVISLFLDDITDAVENRFYPYAKSNRRVGVMEGVQSALWLGLKLIGIHLILFIPYVILTLMGLGLVAVLMFVGVNAWAYGQEYFTMVAARHMSTREANGLYRLYRGDVLMGGLAIAGLFMVPVLNLLTPVLGVALMTHLAHDVMDAEQSGV